MASGIGFRRLGRCKAMAMAAPLRWFARTTHNPRSWRSGSLKPRRAPRMRYNTLRKPIRAKHWRTEGNAGKRRSASTSGGRQRSTSLFCFAIRLGKFWTEQ